MEIHSLVCMARYNVSKDEQKVPGTQSIPFFLKVQFLGFLVKRDLKACDAVPVLPVSR